MIDALRDWIDHRAHYFVSLRDNGQLALALFVVGFAVVFFVGAFRIRRRISRARAAIPLSIGGWGTRGKSGTERLKAAVFHGLGYEVCVKTTGCEAMLIHSVPDEPPHEIFIFRSYDKATIWEQRDTVEIAAALRSEVFLWECMALQPEFVELLQHDWMRDDLVTLTNAFPDHEDVQGPSGADVADCISAFIPYDSTLLTSEVNFLPVFGESARERRTRLRAVAPRDGDLIADDLLALFPYNEHPRNIALVADVAAELGVDRHLAIATMAEHVVPDLGVLKAYPPARVRGRVLRFINGMSANERTGFLNNWQRMELATKDVETMPGEAIVTVVNNRWDRVARSEVFASITVEDAVADVHVLIGTNLRGLRRYIDDALRRYCATIEVVIAADSTTEATPPMARAHTRLAALLARLRVPSPTPRRVLERIDAYAAGAGLAIDPGHRAELARIAERLCRPGVDAALALSEVRREVAAQLAPLRGMLIEHETERLGSGACGIELPEVIAPADRDDVMEHAIRQATRIAVHARLGSRVAAAFAIPGAIAACNQAVAAAYRELFEDALVVIDDPGETGDQIIDRCARSVPPGTTVSVIGVQNIKGTGLDFVYRWLALERTTSRLARLDDEQPAARIAALRELESFEDYGVVDAGVAARALDERSENTRGAPRGIDERSEKTRGGDPTGFAAGGGAPRGIDERSAVGSAGGIDDDEAQLTRTVRDRVRAIHDLRRRALEQAAGRGLWSRIAGQIEGLLDPIDSIRRGRKARVVMADLVARRISHDRAAKEMRSLYDRQAGGWLSRR